MRCMTNIAFYHPSKLFEIFGTLIFHDPNLELLRSFGQKMINIHFQDTHIKPKIITKMSRNTYFIYMSRKEVWSDI